MKVVVASVEDDGSDSGVQHVFTEPGSKTHTRPSAVTFHPAGRALEVEAGWVVVEVGSAVVVADMVPKGSC